MLTAISCLLVNKMTPTHWCQWPVFLFCVTFSFAVVKCSKICVTKDRRTLKQPRYFLQQRFVCSLGTNWVTKNHNKNKKCHWYIVAQVIGQFINAIRLFSRRQSSRGKPETKWFPLRQHLVTGEGKKSLLTGTNRTAEPGSGRVTICHSQLGWGWSKEREKKSTERQQTIQ